MRILNHSITFPRIHRRKIKFILADFYVYFLTAHKLPSIFSCRALHLHNYRKKKYGNDIQERDYEKSNLMNVIFICLFYAP